MGQDPQRSPLHAFCPRGPPCSRDGVSLRRPGCHESRVPDTRERTPAGAQVSLGLGHCWQSSGVDLLRPAVWGWSPGPCQDQGCPRRARPGLRVTGVKLAHSAGWMPSSAAVAPGLQLLLCLQRLPGGQAQPLPGGSLLPPQPQPPLTP